MDAEAVRANLDRYRAAPESVRKAELKSIESVEVVDPRTIRLRLARPDAPLLAVLADRAGMMLSPGSLADGARPELPVCAGHSAWCAASRRIASSWSVSPDTGTRPRFTSTMSYRWRVPISPTGPL